MFVCFSVPGTFKLTVEFTEEYPNKPPTVRFVSKMFHPNGRYPGTQHIIIWVLAKLCLSFWLFLSTVYADGSICLDILQNRWSPTYDVSSILTSIQVRETLREWVYICCLQVISKFKSFFLLVFSFIWYYSPWGRLPLFYLEKVKPKSFFHALKSLNFS